MTKKTLVPLALILLAGCSAQAPEASSSTAPAAQLPSSSIAAASSPAKTIPRYVHARESSRFSVGAEGYMDAMRDRERFVGDQGVFSTHANGAVFGIPHAEARILKTPPWTAGGDAHNAAVVDYFVGAGLPQDQMGPVHVNSMLSGGGPQVDPSPPPTFAGYDSVISRVVDGVPVLDSFAHAHLNAAGEVVAEGVYWPELPAGVVADAHAIASMLSDPARAPVFRSKLPGTPREERVAIRHTSWTSGASFVAQACYEARIGESWRHFDVDAGEVVLPHEIPLSPPQAPRLR